MSAPRNPWFVVETACFPNKWKVTSHYYRVDNSTGNYFPTQSVAQEEARRRNAAFDKEAQDGK